MNAPPVAQGGVLHLLCVGAAQGLVDALRGRFAEDTGARVTGRFGAVGAMRDALLAGEPCDVLVVTAAMVESLAARGELHGHTRADLGRVRTGIAVRRGAPHPGIHSPEALRAALLDSDAIFLPDPLRTTPGIHFADVVRRLDIEDELAARRQPFPNGASTMLALARAGTPRSLGCAQIPEIRCTDGVELVGPLPPRFELATVYTGAATARSTQPALAERFVHLLAGPASRALRAAGGFELD